SAAHSTLRASIWRPSCSREAPCWSSASSEKPTTSPVGSTSATARDSSDAEAVASVVSKLKTIVDMHKASQSRNYMRRSLANLWRSIYGSACGGVDVSLNATDNG